VDLARVPQAALAQLGLDEEGHLERRRRALVGHRRDADDDLAALEGVEGVAELERRGCRVEVLGLGVEVLDRLGDDPAARREDQVVVRQDGTAGQHDGAGGLVDSRGRVDNQVDRRVQERSLGAGQALLALAAHRDVHEAWLVDVRAHRVDERDVDLAVVDPLAELAREKVGGQRTTDAAAQDHDPLHDRHRAFSTTISS
jgi:hypothetical protein